jgi:hypothetical protein
LQALLALAAEHLDGRLVRQHHEDAGTDRRHVSLQGVGGLLIHHLQRHLHLRVAVGLAVAEVDGEGVDGQEHRGRTRLVRCGLDMGGLLPLLAFLGRRLLLQQHDRRAGPHQHHDQRNGDDEDQLLLAAACCWGGGGFRRGGGHEDSLRIA